MALSSSLVKAAGKLRPSAAAGPKKDPRAVWKWVLGGLALANVAAFFLLVRPPGGSLTDLDTQLQALRKQAAGQQVEMRKTRDLVARIQTARSEQEKFLDTYFMDRRTTSSTILTEISRAAKEAGLKPKEHAFSIEPVDGSETIGMLTINANYEGSYGDLIRFVNLMDRSRRFLIIDTIQAAPMQEKGKLAARFKMATFVRESASIVEGAGQ